jgi:hypothetical protein
MMDMCSAKFDDVDDVDDDVILSARSCARFGLMDGIKSRLQF